jgi:O-antigen ligase
MVKLKDLISLLVFIGIFLIPFNSWVGIDFLGEFSKESSTIFLLIGFFLLIILSLIKKKVHIPLKNPIYILLIIIHFWFFLTLLFNIGSIINYDFKGISGINRFIRQFGALIISSLFFSLTYYNTFVKFEIWKIFKILRKVFFLSFIIVSSYTLLEIGFVKFNLGFLEVLLNLFDYFPFVDVYLDTKNSRISSVTFEPPALSSYLLTISAWMFSYIITNKSSAKYIPGLLVIVFAYFSDSRSAIVIISIQFILFLYFMAVRKKYNIHFMKIFLALIIGIAFIGLFKGKVIADYIYDKATSFSVDERSNHSISNRTRFGIQYTLGLVFLDNPISGVGFGQQAYESIKLYPKWATKNNYEFNLKYLNEDVDDFPPGYNLYMRLLAETGIVGFLLFSSFLLLILYLSLSVHKKNSDNKGIISLVIFISIIGFTINWIQIDTFRVFGFWINLNLLLYLTKNNSFNLLNTPLER